LAITQYYINVGMQKSINAGKLCDCQVTECYLASK
jgi:hypothetical protein